MSLIQTRIESYVATIVMNHPERRNALSEALIGEMIAALDSMRDSARVVVLRAPEGAKVWSSGHDVGELPMPGRDPLGYEDSLVRVLRAVEQFPIPVMAMIDASVWGGACDLAFTCDVLVGGPKAAFTMTPAKLGVPYNPSGLLRFMNVLGVNEAKEMFFSARPVDAERAHRLGLLNHLVPSAELESFTYGLAESIAANSPLSIRAMKESFQLLASASPLPPNMFERIQGLRRKVYDSQDYREGIRAFLEKRSPVFKGK